MSAQKIFKVEAEGDAVYVKAENAQQAKLTVREKIDVNMPLSLLTATEVAKLPDDEVFL